MKDNFLTSFYFEKSVYSVESTLEKSIVKIQGRKLSLDFKTAKYVDISSFFKMVRFRQCSLTVLLRTLSSF